MANTRKKALLLHQKINEMYSGKKILYLSTGIRKKDRKEIIKKLQDKAISNYVLVSTQVVESGVDISFSRIFREEAPLDSIIQVLGRLNREGVEPEASLTIYHSDGSPVPYSPLEFQATMKIINNVKDSIQIYKILEEYYEEIYRENQNNMDGTKKLERYIEEMNFDEIWKFINAKICINGERDTVIIPDLEDYDTIYKLINDLINKKDHKILKKFGELTASLPISLSNIDNKMFDEKLFNEGILMPKKEYLEIIYHKDTGLDTLLISDDLK